MFASTFSFLFASFMDCFFSSFRPQLNASNCDSNEDSLDSASENFDIASESMWVTFAGITEGAFGSEVGLSRLSTFDVKTVDVFIEFRVPDGLKVETESSSVHLFGKDSLSSTGGVLISISGVIFSPWNVVPSDMNVSSSLPRNLSSSASSEE